MTALPLQARFQLFAALSTEEYAALRDDIARRGVLVPVELDETGTVLDGHHRIKACEELGITEYPRFVRTGLHSDEEKRSHVRALNLLRRHLSQEQRRQVIADQLRETPEQSNRQVAAALGVDGKTVAAVRRDPSAEIPQIEQRTVTRNGITFTQKPKAPAILARAPIEERGAIDAATRIAPEGVITYGVASGAVRELLNQTRTVRPQEPERLASLMTSDSPEWYTPKHIIERVVQTLGTIDLDPCSNSGPVPNVPAAKHFTAADDGLSEPWNGRVYMNPPYGRGIEDWIERLCDGFERSTISAAIALVPARTDTDWWERLSAYPACFIHGRLKFSDHENSAPFPSAAVYLGKDVAPFIAAFGGLGPVYGRIDGG